MGAYCSPDFPEHGIRSHAISVGSPGARPSVTSTFGQASAASCAPGICRRGQPTSEHAAVRKVRVLDPLCRRSFGMHLRVLAILISAVVVLSEDLLEERGRTVKGHRSHDPCGRKDMLKSCSCKKHLELRAAQDGWATTLRVVILRVAPRILYLLLALGVALVSHQTGIGSVVQDALDSQISRLEP